jgi:hypothetical protein
MLRLDNQIEIAAYHDEPGEPPSHFPIVHSPFSTSGWFVQASHCQYVSTYMNPKVIGRVLKFELPKRRALDYPIRAL